MHKQSIIDSILAKLDTSACVVKNISLVCAESALKSRLEKDISLGIRKLDIIERSTARLPLYSQLDTVKLDTTGKTVLDIASEIENL